MIVSKILEVGLQVTGGLAAQIIEKSVFHSHQMSTVTQYVQNTWLSSHTPYIAFLIFTLLL